MAAITSRPGALSPWPRSWPADGVVREAQPAKKAEGPGTLRGFLLPFSLIAMALRDKTLRRGYLRVTLVRVVLTAVLAGASALAAQPMIDAAQRISVAAHTHAASPDRPRKTTLSRVSRTLKTFGERLEAEGREDIEREKSPVATPSVGRDPVESARYGKAWLVYLIALLAWPEAIVIFLSRRWDDWHSAQLARVAGIRPDDERTAPPRVTLDFGWVARKMKNKLRAWLLFAIGLTPLLLLKLVPAIGEYLFAVGLMTWGLYGCMVATAGKSAHAWVDDGRAPAPSFIRKMLGVGGPIALYARLLGKVGRGVDAPAAMCARAPAAFVGLAWARMFLSLPGVYLLTRPILPVAAGRLIAEVDPEQRFFDTTEPRSTSGS